jgi:hypothetical protein
MGLDLVCVEGARPGTARQNSSYLDTAAELRLLPVTVSHASALPAVDRDCSSEVLGR